MIRMLAICMVCFYSTKVLAQDDIYQPLLDLVDNQPVSEDIVDLS